MLQDRRQHQRVIPNQPLFVRWGQSESVLLSDLSEEGLAIDGIAPNSSAAIIPLAFDLPGGRGHIRTAGEIAWTNDSQNRAGLRFVDLAGTCRQQLREWISASVFYTPELAVANQDSTQSFCLADETGHAGLPGSDDEDSSRQSMSAYLMLFALGALSLFSGVVFARHYLGGPGDQQIKEITARSELSEISPAAPIAPANSSHATTRFLPPTLPLSVPGLVLQVAAMQHEGNADALAKTLQKRNFPAFVFQRGANAFYRVAVGVYGDPGSAARVKDQLGAQGFQTILKRWSPV